MIVRECSPASHLYIAVPAYTGEVSADTSHSLNEAVGLLGQAGVTVSVDYACGCCYLDHTRDMLATRFLHSNATDLLFVDADVGFEPEAALKIVLSHRPFVAGIYPKKSEEPNWPVGFAVDVIHAEPDGCVEAAMVPTGFLRLNREVVAEMVRGEYRDDMDRVWKSIFYNGVRDGLYYGEDVNLCLDWRARGGKIHIIPELLFSHNGMKRWTGSWGAWMRSRLPAMKAPVETTHFTNAEAAD